DLDRAAPFVEQMEESLRGIRPLLSACEGHRCSRMCAECAVRLREVLRTRGDHQRVVRSVEHPLTRHTSQEEGEAIVTGDSWTDIFLEVDKHPRAAAVCVYSAGCRNTSGRRAATGPEVRAVHMIRAVWFRHGRIAGRSLWLRRVAASQHPPRRRAVR